MLDSDVRPPQLSDYGALIRHQWWVVALLTVAGILAAALFTSAQPKVFTSTTEVLVTATGVDDDAVSANGRTQAEINLDTEAQLITSTAVVALAAELLGSDVPVTELAEQVRVSVPPNTEVLAISFDADTAVGARDGAGAFAMAYLANRAEAAGDQITAREQSRRLQVVTLSESLQEITASLNRLPDGSADRAVAEAQIQSLSAQIAILAAEANALDSTAVSPGRTITDAALPNGPSSPVLVVNLAAGAMLGLLLGLGCALLRQRSGRRLRNAEDVTRHTAVPVLVSVPASSGAWLAETASEAGQGYVRLRNVLTAKAAPEDRIILVAGVDRDGSEVAVNLAAALARTGAEVVLVSTHAGSQTMNRLGLARRWAGLSEVLGGQAALSDALQVPAGLETLHILTPGRDPVRAADLLETEAAAELFTSLRGLARYTIVETPPTASAGQAQTLAALADRAVVVVRARGTTADDVRDAVDQFAAVGTPVLGGVLILRRRQARFRGLRSKPATEAHDRGNTARDARAATTSEPTTSTTRQPAKSLDNDVPRHPEARASKGAASRSSR